MNFAKCTPSERKVGLTQSTGQLVGFVDLGKVNEELDRLAVSFYEGEQ